jgi:transposase-like protein
MTPEPSSLQEAVVYFSNLDNCVEYIAARRWPNGVVCPGCGGTKVSFNAKRRTWKCGSHHPKREFSVKVGTIYEDSPISLDKWLTATWLLTNCKNGISSYEIARDLKVTQKTAWFMLHRLRLAMQDGSTIKLGGGGGEVEADESFIGGKSRNMHKHIRARKITAAGVKDKTAVMGILERGGKVRTMVVETRKKKEIQAAVRKHVQAGAALYTDSLRSYNGMTEYEHQVVDHAVQYVDGKIHTNGLENYWSLLKRGINGTYVSVEPFHLFRYLDEQSFRYNHRATEDNTLNDADRFDIAVRQIVGKRITFAELTGKPN